MEEQTIDSIQRIMGEIDEAKHSIKTIRDNITDVLEQNEDYRRLRDELKVLTSKRAELKKLMQDDKDYQQLASELEELRFKHKDLQEILSHHLVAYYSETQSTEVTDAQGETHNITISAKIGR